MDEVSNLVARTWALQEAYEFTPDTDFEETNETVWGQVFRLGGTARLSGVAWYRGSTGTPGPASLSIWDNVSGVRLWRTESPPDNGAVGWQQLDLTDTPFDFAIINSQPMITAYGGSGVHRTYGSQSAAFVGEVPVNVNQQAGFRNNSIGDQRPTSVHTGTVQGLDARFEIIPLANQDVISPNVEAELARWLSEAGDHYNDSRLPFIAGQAAGANEAAQDAVTAIVAQQSDVNVLLSRLTEDVAAKLTVFLNDYGIDARGFFDQITTQVQDVSDAQADIIIWFGEYTGIPLFTYLGNLLKFLNGVNSPPQLAEGDDWELVDETDFTNNLLWPVEADVYRVTLSDFDPAGTIEQVGTETRHAYLGKWCPFNVQFSSEWHYFNTASADLYLGGRMPGLGLILYRPGAGHVQAWRRTEAP